MALRQVRKNLDRLFDKSLTDLIRGIRNNKDNEARYIAACIEEMKEELRQDSIYVKANAIEKLCYLQMLGYDISWASFNIIEVMASTKYTEKRVGYLAAAQSFHENTDVLMLTTNLIRKDLNSSNMFDSGVALGGLACFVTPDLARDLCPDIVNLLSSSRPYTRKRAVLLLYKVFLKYPDALRPTFPRLKERLEDPDPGVQSAAVNVICELARKNPKNYLTLAPVFFKLMTTSSNNWMLIKIIKLFGALVPLEKRLGNKLLEPLTNLINSTSAMSLLYECINTVIAVLISVSSNAPGDQTASIQLCVQKLGVLIEDSDQNLKYLGLLAMGKILQTHPKAVTAHKDIVLHCLDDKDESIRLRALDLLYGMVSKKNIIEIVRKLMEHVESAEGSHYRDELLSRIISICSYNNYQYITNFEWYISVLVELTKVEGTKHGAKIAEQIQDVTVRVESIRHFSVSQMSLLVENAQLLLNGSACQRSNMSEVLLAAAWICGEYSEHVSNIPAVLEAMLKSKIGSMPGHILSVYIQNMAKLYTKLLVKSEQENDWDALYSLDNLMLSKLPAFELAEHLEAQERACSLSALIRVVEGMHERKEKIGDELSLLFEGELNPVAPKAQKKVPVPEGLDLDAWIGTPWEESEEEEEEGDVSGMFGIPTSRSISGLFRNGDEAEEAEEDDGKGRGKKKGKKSKTHEETPEEMERRRRARQAEIESNPYYVKGASQVVNSNSSSLKRPTKMLTSDKGKTESIQSPLEIPGVVGLSKYMEQQDATLSWKNAKKQKKTAKTKGGRRKKREATVSSSSEEDVRRVDGVNRDEGEMPEDAKSTDEEEETTNGANDEFKALDINLDDVILAPSRYQAPRYSEVSYSSQSNYIPAAPPSLSTTSIKKKLTKPKEKKKKRKGEEKSKEAALLDIDSWYDDEKQGRRIEEVAEVKGEKLKKKKKKKEGDESKKSLMSRANEYEEALGVCTPSDGPSQSPLTQSTTTTLLTNENLSLDVTSYDLTDSNSISLRLLNLSQLRIKRAELSLCDAPSIKISTSSNLVTKEIERKETKEMNIVLEKIPDIDSYTLKGTLFYRMEDDKGDVREEQCKVLVPLPSFVFLQASTVSTDAYSVLLSSGEVDSSSSSSISSLLPFKAVLSLIVSSTHFSVVEEESSAASLFSSTSNGQSVCLLVKKSGDTVTVCVKANTDAVARSMISDLSTLIQRRSI